MSMYVLATLKLKYGQHERFFNVMPKVIELVRPAGWQLLGSYQAVVGSLCQVVDLWEVPDANAVPNGLVAAASDAGFPEIAAELAAIIDDEVLVLMAKTPFSP